MPTNKNALLKYQIHDCCFSNRHRKYTIDDLVDAVNDALNGMYGTRIKVETVLLRFDKERFPYVVSKPIHHSQTIVDEEKHLLQIEVRPNKELEAMLLSFEPQVEILQPQWLRNQFAKKIQEYYKIYSTVHDNCTIES